MTLKDFACYVVSQVLGAIAGSAVLGLILGSFKTLGANGLGGAETALIALIVEIILTVYYSFLFVFVFILFVVFVVEIHFQDFYF